MMTAIDRQCLYCLGPLGEPIFRNVRDRLRVSNRLWTFRRCLDCGSALLDPMPSSEELLRAYPEHYAFDQAPQTGAFHHLLYRLESALFYHPIYRSSVRQVIRVTRLRSGRLLDVGGGTGHRTWFFRDAGFECTVLDPDERPLRIARERFGLQTIQGLLEEIELPPGSFDLITFYAVIEHLPDPTRTLQAASRLLRPGGWIVALVPVLTGWETRWCRLFWRHQVFEAPRHVGLPSPEGMRRLFARCGLELRRWEGNHLLDEAGIIALSVFSASASAIACASTSLFARGTRRAIGAMLTLLAIPFAILLHRIGYPGSAVFFAQKPPRT